MRVSTFIASPVAILALVSGVLSAVVESPPALVTCQPAAITWREAPGGDVFLSVIEGGNPASANLVSFPTQNGASGSYTWNVNLAAGTSITLKLVDSTGANAYSSPITIQAGPNTDCVGQDPSPAAGSSAASSASSVQSSASSAGATSSASSAASSAASAASSGSSSLASAASSSAGGLTRSAASAASGALSSASSVASSLNSAASSAASAATSALTPGGAGFANTQVAMSAVVLGAAGVLGALLV